MPREDTIMRTFAQAAVLDAVVDCALLRGKVSHLTLLLCTLNKQFNNLRLAILPYGFL